MNLFEQTRNRAQAFAGQALAAARQTGRRTADGLEQASRPVHRIAEAGLSLNRISGDHLSRMVRQQTEILDHLLQDSAQRLRLAAGAESLRGLWREQLALLPASRDRLVTDAKSTFGIVRDTSQEFGALLREALASLRRRADGAAGQTAKPPRPAGRRTRKADGSETATH